MEVMAQTLNFLVVGYKLKLQLEVEVVFYDASGLGLGQGTGSNGGFVVEHLTETELTEMVEQLLPDKVLMVVT